MKNKLSGVVFIVVCLLICGIPFICMTFAKTDKTTENKRLSEVPDIVKEDGFNYNYLKDLGAYFGDRFAFRNEMVNADSIIQSDVFGTSNMSTVVKGTDGWLYYTDSLNDYLGKDTMSSRGIYNVAHNLEMIQEYVNSRGADFVFTIPPNKNSLYGENMPYYYQKKVSENKNIKSLTPLLKSKNIKYTDLFSLFNKQDEKLYLMRDSHWNNKGALLAYNKIMDKLNLPHNDYQTAKVSRDETEIGDLNKMLYPLSAKPEWNYYYDNKDYKHNSRKKSVEDPWIETESKGENGTLLMFRDSFGNTLLPFFAGEFKKAYFDKASPYFIEANMDSCKPDCVVIEKVERNIDELASAPPIMTGMMVELDSDQKDVNSKATTLNVSPSKSDASYLEISGNVEKKFIKTNTDIYINVIVNGEKNTYRAFNVSDEKGDNGFVLHLPKDTLSSPRVPVEVVLDTNGKLTKVKTKVFKIKN